MEGRNRVFNLGLLEKVIYRKNGGIKPLADELRKNGISGASRQTIHKWFKGTRPDQDTVYLIARYLGIDEKNFWVDCSAINNILEGLK